MKQLQVSHLTAGYHGREVVHDLSFALPAGQVLGVLGANGSGKTTLIKAICGILPHKGQCTLDGQALERLRPKALARLCGYIPQRSGLSIELSALDVVLMGFNPHLGLLQPPTPAMRRAASAMLATVGLPGRDREGYLTLSEGQKQLCLLARALAGGAELLLLDEPESALDLRARHRTLHLLREFTAQGDRAVLLSLHDPNLALNFCDALLLVEEGRGAGLVHPGTDSDETLEAALSRIYGPVCLRRCTDDNGQSHLVMLKEEDVPCSP